MSQQGPVFPKDAAPLRTLVAAMAVMCFLAVLAVGAIILIDRAVTHWSRGLATELTVQVRQVSNRDVEKDVAAVLAVLNETVGVREAEGLPRAASEELLAPWIGSEGLDKLPVPRLIRVLIDDRNPPDMAVLEQKISAVVPPARLDSHRRWEAELKRMAGTLSILSWLVLALIALSAIAMVVSASRAVLAANQAIVEVLHLVGADDRFIARAIDRRFLSAVQGVSLCSRFWDFLGGRKPMAFPKRREASSTFRVAESAISSCGFWRCRLPQSSLRF
jgi:cell division transport system permease protein